MNTCFCLCQHKLHAFSLGLDIYLVHLSYPPSPKSGNTPPPRLPTALTPKASPSKSNWFCWSRHCTETPVRDSSNKNQIGQYRFTSGRKKQTINPKSTTTKQFQTSARSSAPLLPLKPHSSSEDNIHSQDVHSQRSSSKGVSHAEYIHISGSDTANRWPGEAVCQVNLVSLSLLSPVWFPIEDVNFNQYVQALIVSTNIAPPGDWNSCDCLAAADQYHQGSYDS